MTIAMKRLDTATIDQTTARSRELTRGRANFNLHPSEGDPIQRFMNVFQPGSYVRPHRHDPDRFELFLVLSGRAAAVVFDDAGAIVESTVLSVDGTRAVEIQGGRWHTLFALDPDTVLFEVKPGPYRPLADKDFAAWAPREGEPGMADLLAKWAAVVHATVE